MKISVLSATLVVVVGVSALPQIVPGAHKAPALPIDRFRSTGFHMKPLELHEILDGIVNNTAAPSPEPAPKKPVAVHTFATEAAASTCSNLRVRPEWDQTSNDQKQAYINAIRCLMSSPSKGQFPQAHSRWEDLAALHQTVTPNVHMNAKFLAWHRVFLHTFETLLTNECGFNGVIPWFDETRYAGRFAQSSLFSPQWYGTASQNGGCVMDGQFANLALNVGPGNDNEYHCLSRNLDESQTGNCNSQLVDGCNGQSDYASMASCQELGVHAWCHNAIGGVMEEVSASPDEPFFYLHHAFVDRNWKIWSNQDANRLTYINGKDHAGSDLTLDTTINVYGIIPDVKIRDILDTTGPYLCYKYSY